MKKLRFISIYLPQFHAIPENDAAWGKGFTEWTNVKKAKPLFWGHYQPHIPHKSIGYYDLGDPEVMVKQAELASAHGIHGFAFYHYWFNGKRLLQLPVDNMLKTKKPDFPFFLIWANESWSRSWIGEEKDIIVEQTYSESDNIRHAQWLIEVLNDTRYIKINNRPVFMIYKPTHMYGIENFITTFKTECLKNNMSEPYLIASNSHAGDTDLRELGFDAILNFEPQLGVLAYILEYTKTLFKVNNISFAMMYNKIKVYDYSRAKETMGNRGLKYPYYPCSFVNWDNSPRRGREGILIKNGTPELFAKYLRLSIEKFKKNEFSEEENLVFINSWNEWAEGNYLEPDQKNGFKYLQALKEVIDEVNCE